MQAFFIVMLYFISALYFIVHRFFLRVRRSYNIKAVTVIYCASNVNFVHPANHVLIYNVDG